MDCFFLSMLRSMEFHKVLAIHEYFLNSRLRSMQRGDKGLLDIMFGDCLQGAYNLIG